MQEPEFKAIDPRRRFLWWFVPPLAVFVAGLAVLLVSGHITGPFQRITVVRVLIASKRELPKGELFEHMINVVGDCR